MFVLAPFCFRYLAKSWADYLWKEFPGAFSDLLPDCLVVVFSLKIACVWYIGRCKMCFLVKKTPLIVLVCCVIVKHMVQVELHHEGRNRLRVLRKIKAAVDY